MISLETIRHNLGNAKFSKGEKLYRAGRVIRSEYEIDVLDEEDIASGTYLSSNDHEHDLEISVLVNIITEGIEYTVQGACTCCGRFNCEHIAAVLISAVQGAGEMDRYEPGTGSSALLPDQESRLPGNVGVWLDTLRTVTSVSNLPAVPEVAKKPSQDAIFYVFEMGHHGFPIIQPYKVFIKKDGSLGAKFTRYLRFDPANPPRFLEASDLAVMAKLLFYGVDAYGSIPEWPEQQFPPGNDFGPIEDKRPIFRQEGFSGR